VMYLGEVIETGRAVDVVSKPRHPYTVALRSATPVAYGEEVRSRVVLKGDPPSPLNPPSGCTFHTRCPIARPVCATEKPVLDFRGGPWRAACHFADELK
jgi:oligopeptide/dipeptide ABC transporter ATP-binding protein